MYINKINSFKKIILLYILTGRYLSKKKCPFFLLVRQRIATPLYT